jgi:glycerophosphoryl diester phosphodiesterase
MKSDPPLSQNSRLGFFEQAPDIDVIAHRGGNGQWPGETTYAFTRALESGADVIEMDVWGTADDPPVLVLMHSSDISKMTEGSGNVSRLNSRTSKISTPLTSGRLMVGGPFRLGIRTLF